LLPRKQFTNSPIKLVSTLVQQDKVKDHIFFAVSVRSKNLNQKLNIVPVLHGSSSRVNESRI
ncbi:MAG: hypothetical protein ACWGQW_24155, partial [bacterium]